MEEFSCKTRILSGGGAVQALSGMGAKRLFLVTDPFFVKNGTAKRIAELANCQETEIFDQVQPDPTVELAAEGTARLRAFAPDLLVALGVVGNSHHYGLAQRLVQLIGRGVL